MRNWIVVAGDVETSDVDCFNDHMIEVGLIRFECTIDQANKFHKKEIASYVSKVALPPKAKVSPTAAKINGYTEEAWVDAPPLYKVVSEMVPYLEGATFIAHNAHFDIGFLKSSFNRCRRAWPRMAYRVFDTGSYAHLKFLRGDIEASGLDALVEYYGLTRGRHSAENDARLAMECYSFIVENSLKGV